VTLDVPSSRRAATRIEEGGSVPNIDITLEEQILALLDLKPTGVS
jgi:hypothetical protein